MVKKLIILLFLLGTILSVNTACSGNEVGIGEEFTLHPGESVKIKGEEVEVKFLEVTGDSRCPSGVTCIWAGEVSCLVEITYHESIEKIELTEPGLTDFPPEQDFHEYKLTYHVEPYPAADTPIPKEEYRLEMTISK